MNMNKLQCDKMTIRWHYYV